jgi:MSHA biogenesis protein MshP
MTAVNQKTGFGLPTAIFIILIMSLIAIVITRQSQVSAELYSRNFLSTQALLAAEAGIELNLTELTRTNGSCLTTNPITFSTTGLQGCSATFVCQSQSVDGITFTDVTSTGTCGQGIDASARRIRVKFWL